MKLLPGYILNRKQRQKAIVLFSTVNTAMLLLFLCLRLFPPDQYSFYPECLWHSLTHTYCPGCGSTRTVNAIAHGEFGDLFKYNVMIPLSLPFLFYWYIMQGISVFTGKRLLILSFKNRELYAIPVMVVLFGLIRNFIPFLSPTNGG